MKIPLSWLKEYVEIEDSVEGLADKLTFSGAEVEAIERIGNDFEGIVAGEITAVDEHPDADRLSVCKVADGKDEFQVVCGAPNCTPGGKHPFAKVGTVLPGDFKIKKAKLRGVESHGMLCAEDELGMSEDHSGLMELPADAVPGTPLAEIMGPPEIVFDLEITPNRPDCLSIMGIAREVAAIYGKEMKRPDTELVEEEQPGTALTAVDIENADACPRYTARVLQNVEVGPSPDWMQKRLQLAGVRPINNIVDITNYVLLECGHPLHAFDHSLLQEGRIVVRNAKPGEPICTLDDEEHEMDEDMLVIADAGRPVALAGIMGGADSEIGADTNAVLLESAYFSPAGIRHTSRKLGITSESSYRFVRGTDCNGVEWASRRAAALMQKHANARVLRGVVDEYPNQLSQREIDCNLSSVSSLLGIEISMEDIIGTFESLEMEITAKSEYSCKVKVPSFRLDLEREVDLAEEYARIYGMDNIPEATPKARIVPQASDKDDQARSVCRNKLVGLGLQEIMNYSLLSPDLLDTFGLDEEENRVALPHPISADQSVLRTTLIPQLVESLGRNNMRQVRSASFFEMGKVFYHKDENEQGEDDYVSLGLMGPRGRIGLERFKPASEDDMFLWLKGIITTLLAEHNIDSPSFEQEGNPPFIASHSTVIQIDGRNIGIAGVVKPSIASHWRIQGPIAVAEMRLQPVIARTFDVNRYTPISTQPAVERDIALIAGKQIKHRDIMATIQAAAPEDLEDVQLFDVFTGKGIPEGRKSLAYALTYRAQDKTLTDEEANKYHDRIKAEIRDNLDVEIRE